MAHNYTQPFYGFPFAYPPAQSGEPAAPPNGQPASAPDAFQNIPGLGGSQNPPPFPAPTWPPQFPLDPNMWPPQQFLPFLQNGMLPPPPFFHPPAFPPALLPALPPAPQNAAPHAHLPPHPPQPAVPASDRIQEVMDSDREDGEVSDADVSSKRGPASANVNGTGTTHHEPPRSVPQAPPPSSTKTPALTQEERLQKDRDEAKEFIKTLNSNNIGYPALANEGLDKELLRGLYQSLNLPSEPVPIPAPKVNGAPQKPPAQTPSSGSARQPTSSSKVQQQKPAPTVKTDVASAPSAKSAASPTGPIDRKDYVARLQAAKKAKQAVAAKPSSPRGTSPTQAVSPDVAVQTPQAATTPTTKPPVTDEQRARNTELIKQRLEAMRAKQKPSIPVINKTKLSSSLSHRPEQARAAVEPVTHVPQTSVSSPTTPMNMSSIPGLFMSNPQPSIPQKRPAPSDTEPSILQGSKAPYNQHLGQSSHARQTIAVEVSDNESNGSAMDIDDDQTGPKPLVVSQPVSQSQRQPPGDMAEVPSRPTSTKPASTVGTPGAHTPATSIREKELEDKEKQLAAMRLTLKKKLAEKREKDRATAAAVAAAANTATDTVASSPPHSTSPSEPVAELSHPVRLRPISDMYTPAHSSIEPVRSTKRLRRAEIESRLPSLDAEIATNTSRIAQLTREMEELKAQNERIAKDKEQLTEELESLGIDTEGMSHQELLAKKEEIQQEQSPEPENTPQGASSVPQPAMHDSNATSSVNSQYAAPPHADVGESQGVRAWPAQGKTTSGYAHLPGLGQVSQVQSGTAAFQTQNPIVDNSLESKGKVIALPTPQDDSQSDKAVTGAGMRGTSIHASLGSGTRLSATPLDDEEDFYSPPAAITNLDETVEIQPAAVSPAEEGEVEMSESSDEDAEEEEYEPDEPMDLTSTPIQEAQFTAPNDRHSLAPSQVSTEDEEDYEPPDVDDVPEPVQVSLVEPDEDAMDLAISSSEASSDTDSDDETSPEPEARTSISDRALQQETNIANDSAPRLQVQVVPALSAPEPVTPAGDDDEKVTFTPYESPLRFFKSYRYHPGYAHDVAGGFLSLTYSHQIDAEKLLCPFESAGDACTDAHCPHQHFRDLSITGEKLLVQLGTANPGKTQTEKQKWNDGLRGVLRELRQKNIKDPNGIAVEIAKYRREFLNDDTRVINL